MLTESYRNIIQNIARTNSAPITVFADFCRMAACALAAGSREVEYQEVARRYDREELNEISKAFGLLVNEMQDNPFIDILGEYYLEIAPRSSK